MKIVKKIGLCILLLALLSVLGVAGYGMYLEINKTPDEIKRIEADKTAAAHLENLNTALAKRQEYDFVVVLNPAHGGLDHGNENAFGLEKDINLAICNKVIAANTNPEIGIFLTRTQDVGMDTEMRLEVVEELQPDMFIDVHINKNTNVGAYGTSVNYDTTYYNRKLSNVEFADIMEKSVVTAVEGFAVGILDVTDSEEGTLLKGLAIPAVSIACGDMSNEMEGELLTRDNYQMNLAGGIMDGIYQAKEKLEKY